MYSWCIFRCVCVCNVCMRAKLLPSCPTLFDPMDRSPPGSSVHGILQARILEWVAISYSRGSSQPRDQTHVSYISSTGRWVLYHHLPPGKLVSVIIEKRYKDVRMQKSFSVVALSIFPASLPSSTPPHLTFSFRVPLRKILPWNSQSHFEPTSPSSQSRIICEHFV